MLDSKLGADGANPQATGYEYLLDNSLKKISYTNELVPTADVSFTYDNTYPRVVTMTDGTGTTNYAYKAVNTSGPGDTLLASIDGPLANDTMTFAYDELGR